MAERIKLGGLWMNRSKDGVDYLTGKLSPTVKILIFKNNFKQNGDNQPTHVMYLAPVDPDPNAQREQNTGGDSFFGASSELGEFSGEVSGEGEDDFVAAAPVAPQRPAPQRQTAAPAPRTNTPSAQQPTRPMNAASTNTRPAGQGTPPQRRQPTPPPPADDMTDFDDPFGD